MIRNTWGYAHFCSTCKGWFPIVHVHNPSEY